MMIAFAFPAAAPVEVLAEKNTRYWVLLKISTNVTAVLESDVDGFVTDNKTVNIFVNAGPVVVVIVLRPFPDIDSHLTNIPDGKYVHPSIVFTGIVLLKVEAVNGISAVPPNTSL